jgi:GNAT superfamily N-acetyltransferase
MIWRALTVAEIQRIADYSVTIDPYRTLGYQSAQLVDYLSRPDPALDRVALEKQGLFLGALCRRSPWLRGALIEMVTLLPEAQGKGLGGAVLQRCQSESGRNLWATVSEFNLPARRFYARHGFVELCPLSGLIMPDQDELLLRWRHL